MYASPHQCLVHACVVDPGAARVGRGDLEPLGEQWPRLNLSATAPRLGGLEFYRAHVRPKVPYLLRDAVVAPPAYASDAALDAAAGGWTVIVEQQNRILHDHREPYWIDWNFSRFLRTYPHSPYYLIAPGMPAALRLPLPREVDECKLLRRNVGTDRLWMSDGNTSSSVHFDTHDTILQQLAGTKEVYLWPPEDVAGMAMDHHTRYGLSPINVDRVDRTRFADLARPQFVHLAPGDLLYVPSMTWHQLRSHPGRNVMLTWEFEYKLNIPPAPTRSKTESYQHAVGQMRRRMPSTCDPWPRGRPRRATAPAPPPPPSSPTCQSHCRNPCEDLNGDYRRECGECAATEAACHPGVFDP